MRSVDLALYADELAARAATLAAQLERARRCLRQEAIEREARRALDEGSVARLDALGLTRRADVNALCARSGSWRPRSRSSRPGLRNASRQPRRTSQGYRAAAAG